jgi:hypothetical protein
MRHTECVSSLSGKRSIDIFHKGDTFPLYSASFPLYCSVTKSRCASRGFDVYKSLNCQNYSIERNISGFLRIFEAGFSSRCLCRAGNESSLLKNSGWQEPTDKTIFEGY